MKINNTNSNTYAVDREILKRKIMLHYLNLMKQRYKYTNLPESIPEGVIEEYIFKYDTFAFGTTTMVKYPYTLYGGNIGTNELDMYGYTVRANCTLTGTYINYQKQITDDENGVFWQPDGQLSQSLYKQIEPYVEKMIDIHQSHKNNIKLSNTKLVVEGEVGAVNQAVRTAMDTTDTGSLFVVMDTTNKDMTEQLLTTELGMRALNFDVQYNPIAYYQDFKNAEAKINNILGIEHNSSNKRERNNVEEVGLDMTETNDKQEYMFSIREKFIEKINKLFGLDIQLERREEDVYSTTDISGAGLDTNIDNME